MDFSFGFREVIPDQTQVEKWTEINLNTGGTQSTLQDFKFAEKTGGFSYKDQKKYYTRNRFIYWRICNDQLELVEHSLDVTLTGNRVRYKFADTPVLDGVTICEVSGAIFVLVATVSSVHRLSFPHPDVIHSKQHVYPRAGVEFTAHSIFAEATLNDARNPSSFHVINNTYTNSAIPHTNAAGISAAQDSCLFALAYGTGTILLISMDIMSGNVNISELNQYSDALMPRFLSRAFRGKNNEDAIPVSLLLQAVSGETLLFSLCRDGNIRLWSTQKQHCAVVTDFPTQVVQGAQTHQMKPAFGVNGELFIGVLHCFPSYNAVHILKVGGAVGGKLNLIETVNIAQGKDVVDFAITGNLEVWTILRSATGETSLAMNKDDLWQYCELDTPWEREEVAVDPDVAPKQAYLDFIFYPGRFPVSVISKALSIYRKANTITDMAAPTQILKERVGAIVDVKIYGEIRDRELSADEILQYHHAAWQKFYSCVVEYYTSGTKPLGLLLLSHPTTAPPLSESFNDSSILYKSTHEDSSMVQDEQENDEGEMSTSGVVVIKKSYFSFLRPMDHMESIALNNADLALEASDGQLSPDLVRLTSVLVYLDDNLPEEAKLGFEKSLKQLKTPIFTVAELFSQDFSFGEEETMTSYDLVNNLAVNLEEISDLEAAVIRFLDLLDVGQPDVDDNLSIEKTNWIKHLGHLYGSQLGMSFVATSVQQMVSIRFILCRCLLILQQLLNSNSFQNFLPKKVDPLPTDLQERTSHLIQCYYLLLWISQTPTYPLQLLDNVETSVSVLKLNAGKNPLLVPHPAAKHKNITLLHLFLQTSASVLVRLLLSKRDVRSHLLPLWRHSFLPYVHVLTQLVWPVCGNTIFPEFLLFCGQHLHMQEYTRLLSKWCHSNSYSRKFLSACSLLDLGEHYKAFDLFNKAYHGVQIDDFIRRRVAQVGDDEDRTQVMYYVQVMKLFEQQGLHDIVVEIAEKAISVAKPNDPELATLHSVSFLHQLALRRYKAAFAALLANPDGERRKDCLQQLVVTLVDAKRLDILMDFDYNGIRPELERIIDARARSLDVRDNLYYNFAYAYHIKRGTFRRAGCVMYEQAYRLAAETGREALEKQCQCYVAAITVLSLVKPEDAWIVKPAPVTDEIMEINEDIHQRKVEVLELSDLRKELALCRARLALLDMSPDHSKAVVGIYSATEMVGLLTNAMLFTHALDLARLFGVPKDGVFSGLAGVCVRMDESQCETTWDWLTANGAADLGDGSAATLSWRLLETLLMKEEKDHNSQLHRCVTLKLIQLGVFLPHWLVASYKTRNAAELLRLLRNGGRLEEAAELAIEYILAVLGTGKDRFGLDTALLPQHPAVWLPVNILDLIIMELEYHLKEDEVYKELHSKLTGVLKQYLASVVSVSEDKLKILQEEACRGAEKMSVC